jgi:four helix bundle protein
MSIDANIAEGRGQNTDREFGRYLKIAINSAFEVEAHLLMARDTSALNKSDCLQLMEQLVEVRRMLYGLVKRVNANSNAARS